jgi:hypothetical protein
MHGINKSNEKQYITTIAACSKGGDKSLCKHVFLLKYGPFENRNPE